MSRFALTDRAERDLDEIRQTLTDTAYPLMVVCVPHGSRDFPSLFVPGTAPQNRRPTGRPTPPNNPPVQRFARLFERLDATTSTDQKLAALRDYFAEAPSADAAWALHFLSGRKMKRLVGYRPIRDWAQARAGVADWLFAESYSAVGDLAETAALLVDAAEDFGPPPDGEQEAGSGSLTDLASPHDQLPLFAHDDAQPFDGSLSAWVERRVLTLRGLPPQTQIDRLDAWSRELDRTELFLLIKMLTGAMRVGVSRTLVEKALAQLAGVDQAVVAHRLMGEWSPTPEFLQSVLSGDDTDVRRSRPYPFFLASQLVPPELPDDFTGDEADWVAAELENPDDWLAEWKWDGIRAQLIRRGGEVFLWSRGDDNLTERFPEITDAAARLPDDAVLDGEVLAWDHEADAPRDFGVLQTRIGRTDLSARALAQAPAVFMAYDLLEAEGEDLRGSPIEDRLARLARLLEGEHTPPAAGGRGPGGGSSFAVPMNAIRLASPFPVTSWAELARVRQTSRQRRVEGLMLKRRGSTYQSGRRRGDWWKWKVDPLTIDAVLVYAEPGHGRRANLLTDYTFAVWTGPGPGQGELTPFTKAYSGLTDQEIGRMDRWIRQHTTERFGPVRAVEPHHVLEIACDSVRLSDRHKSGVALRFPRMKRWRHDKPADQADTIAFVRSLIRHG